MRNLLALVLLFLAVPTFGVQHGDRFTIDSGRFAFQGGIACGDIAGSDALDTIVCSGELTMIFEKDGNGWSVFAPPLPGSTSVDINFGGSRIVTSNGWEARLYERDDSGTDEDRTDDGWLLVKTFSGGADVAIARVLAFAPALVLVGDATTGQSTLYCGADLHVCRTIDGYNPVAIDAIGYTIAATDPASETVYYSNEGVQKSFTGLPNSEFGHSLDFGAVGLNYFVIGAPEEENAEGIPAGSCHFYLLEDIGEEWDFLPFGSQDAPEGLTNGRFCHSTGMWSGPGHLLVGAPLANDGAGMAFLIEDKYLAPTEWTSISPHSGSDRFGWSTFVQRVGIEGGGGEYNVVGEPFSDRLGEDAGEALIQVDNPYIFSDGFESGDTCAWTRTCPRG